MCPYSQNLKSQVAVFAHWWHHLPVLCTASRLDSSHYNWTSGPHLPAARPISPLFKALTLAILRAIMNYMDILNLLFLKCLYPAFVIVYGKESLWDYLSVPPKTFWKDWRVFIKLGMSVMPLEAVLNLVILNYQRSVIPVWLPCGAGLPFAKYCIDSRSGYRPSWLEVFLNFIRIFQASATIGLLPSNRSGTSHSKYFPVRRS